MILEFFIAFFGILYYMSRMGYEKARDADYDRKKKERDEAFNAWENKYVDRDLVTKYGGMINSTDEDYEQIWEMIRDDYAQIPSRKDYPFAPIGVKHSGMMYPYLSYTLLCNIKYIEYCHVQDLLLAHQGKVCSRELGANYGTNYRNTKGDFDYMLHINKVSQENGGPRMLFKQEHTNKLFPVEEGMFDDMRPFGTLVWENPYDHL